MTAIRAHRVGAQPRAATRTTSPRTVFLGPDLPRAACKGLAPLFDRTIPHETPHERDERHHQAIRVCRRCPERVDCLTARLTNPGLKRDTGVFGGQVFDTTITPTRKSACDHCGNPFTTKQPTQRFCTPTCRDRYRGICENNRKPVTTALPGLTHCQGCGTRLAVEQTAAGRRNCSKTCRNRASDRRAAQVAA